MTLSGVLVLLISAMSCCVAPKLENGTGEQCGPPPHVPSGDTEQIRKANYKSGEFVTYRCPSYYVLKGERTVRCTNGVWSEAPECLEPCTASEKDMAQNNIELRWTGQKKLYTEHGNTMEFRCKSGYEAPSGTNMRTTCDQGKLQYPKCFRSGTGQQCGPPPHVLSGDTDQIRKPNYKSGEFVTYKCPSYYVLKGERTVRCTNGVWSEAPECLEPCTASEKDMAQNNIELRWTGQKKLYTEHGKPMEFKCKSGYEAPSGTNMRTACDQGKLQYPKCFRSGFCELQQKTMLINNIHYNISSIVDNGQTVTFQCTEGMNPEDKLEVKCQNGNINYPRCTAAKRCETPKILNGFIRSEQQASYDSGSNVEFDCNEDYVIKGSINVKCENGKWSDLPVCQSPCKVSLEELTKRNIQLASSEDFNLDKNFKHDTELTVTCKSGFRRPNQGDLRIVCEDGKFSYTRCFSGKTCRIDQDEVDKKQLILDELHNNEVYYAEGEEIKFKCKNRLHFSGKLPGRCSDKGLEYPECRGTGEQCGPPPHVPFGDTEQYRKDSYKSGEFVTFRCPSYYVLKGEKNVTCVNGFWSEAPECLEPCTISERDLRVNNLQLRWISDMKLYLAHGESTEFQCKSGYEAPPGTQMRVVCDRGRVEYPKCFEKA